VLIRDIRAELVDWYHDPDMMFFDGFDAAILGTSKRRGDVRVVVDDHTKCQEIEEARIRAARDCGCVDDAECSECDDTAVTESVEASVDRLEGTWLGPRTPIVLDSEELEYIR